MTLLGKAHLYERVGGVWTYDRTLAVPSPFGGSGFEQYGFRTSIRGDRVLVSDVSSDLISGGTAHFYERSQGQWTENTSRCNGAPAFGYSIDLIDDMAIVGAPQESVGSFGSGSGWLYQFDGITWRDRAHLSVAKPGFDDTAGIDVALTGDTLLLGATGADRKVFNVGAAYVFPVPIAYVQGDVTGDGIVGVADLNELLASYGACGCSCCAADLNGDGIVDIQDLLLLLRSWTTSPPTTQQDGPLPGGMGSAS